MPQTPLSRLPQSSVPAEVGHFSVPLQGIMSSQVGIMASRSDHGRRGTKNQPPFPSPPCGAKAASYLQPPGVQLPEGFCCMAEYLFPSDVISACERWFSFAGKLPFPLLLWLSLTAKSKKATYVTKTFKPTCVLSLHSQ